MRGAGPSYTFINSHSQVSDPGPKGPLVYQIVFSIQCENCGVLRIQGRNYGVFGIQGEGVTPLISVQLRKSEML